MTNYTFDEIGNLSSGPGTSEEYSHSALLEFNERALLKFHENGFTEQSLGSRLAKLVDDHINAEELVLKKEEELRIAKKNLHYISSLQLPALMDELGISEFKTKEGTKISVNEDIRASISKKDRDSALAWLDENGYGNIIKREFKVQFENELEVQEFKKFLDSNNMNICLENVSTVHHATLSSFIRDLMSEGCDEVPLDIFGVVRLRKTKISESV